MTATLVAPELKRRTRLVERLAQLKNEQSSWRPDWQDCADFILPRAPRLVVGGDTNRGGRRSQHILDDSATYSLRILGAGLMAGATSPARPWFKLTTPHTETNELHEAKTWLEDVAQREMRVFQKSNFYRVIHQLYEDIAVFGTGAAILVQDDDDVIHLHSIPVGEFYLAQDSRGRVNTFYREFEMTVAQMAHEFGMENCSHEVQQLFKRGTLDTMQRVVHAIEPRKDRDVTKLDNKNMEWASLYFELNNGLADAVLRESGFKKFPVIAPRWHVRPGDVYGSSPALDAIGNVRGLQHRQKRKAQAIDYQTRPPLQVPTTLRNRDVDTLPGGITHADSPGQTGGIRPLWETRLDLSHLTMDIEDVRRLIRAAFHTDLFLMLIGGSDTQKTKAEIDARTEEKLIVLGPVLERLTTEMLNPAIDLTFDIMAEAGLVPPAPPEVQGVDMTVEYVSMLAQAQRAIGTTSMERLLGVVGAVAQWNPEVIDKINVDHMVDDFADRVGVAPKNINPTEQAQALRERRNAALAAKEQAAALEQQAAAAKDFSAAPIGTGSALDALGQFSGYGGGV